MLLYFLRISHIVWLSSCVLCSTLSCICKFGEQVLGGARRHAQAKHGGAHSMPIFSSVKGRTFDGNFVERVMRCSVCVIVAVQCLFFALGGIRDNLFNGRVVMPDEEYLQSWFYDTKLGESENHSVRMDTIGKCWGTFIATIALLKMATALSGGTQPLSKTLAVIFVATNM